MRYRPFRMGVIVITTMIGTLAAVPAHAVDSPFIVNSAHYEQTLMSCSGSGTTSTTGTSSPSDSPIVANAPATAANWSGTSTFTIDASNSATQTYAATTSVRTTTAGANPASIEMSYAASYRLDTTGSVACSGSPDLAVYNNYMFTTTQPLLVSVTLQGTGQDFVEARIWSQDGYLKIDPLLENVSGRHSESHYLPAGSYSGLLEGDLYKQDTSGSQQLSSSGSAKITFSVPGSASAGPAGNAGRYISFAKNRTCGANNLQTTLTSNKAFVKRIKKVVYSKNGRIIRTVKGRAIRRGLIVKYTRLDPRSPVTVKAMVFLNSGRRLSESATYRPCNL